VGYGSTPYSVHGKGIQAMADMNQTVAAGVYKYHCIETTGVNTATPDLILPNATDAASYFKFIRNNCSGGFGVRVIDVASGTSVTVADGKMAIIMIHNNGAVRVTPDT